MKSQIKNRNIYITTTKTIIIALIILFFTCKFINCNIQMVDTENRVFTKDINLNELRNRALYKMNLDYSLAEKHAFLLDYYQYDQDDQNILRFLVLTSYHLQNLFDAKYYLDRLLSINPNNRFALQFKEQRYNELEIENSYRSYESNNFRFYYPNPDIYSVSGSNVNTYNKITNLARKAEEKFVFILNDFSFRPREKIPVIFYGGEHYDNLNNFNYETSGYFDGKIRLNIRYIDHPYYINVFIHESIHALIYYIAGFHVPVWFHEGMAQYYEKNKSFTVNLPSNFMLNFIKLEDIEKSFNLLENYQINQAYVQSLLLIRFLKERYGDNIVFELLEEFGRTRDYNTVYLNVLFRDRSTLESEFKEFLRNTKL